ncbi:MAG: hypothetical protein DHS80DRAFT_22653 [Piptocephalis tieghemiana]|nr:MAG: hypothetical protein DHS80DRAFT_22653 [Piptocephalis tieghemiana]
MSQIVRHAASIKLTFPPISFKAKSARIFLSRIQTEEAFQANPTCKITTDLNLQAPDATVSVKYKDGKTMDLVTSTIPVQEVLSVFGKHAKKLQEAEDALN